MFLRGSILAGAVALAALSVSPASAQGVFTLAAAATGEEAQEVAELGHGVLTYSLLAALSAAEGGPLRDHGLPSGQNESVARVLDWFGFASDQVPRLTKRYYGKEQDVQMSAAGADFPLLPLRER